VSLEATRKTGLNRAENPLWSASHRHEKPVVEWEETAPDDACLKCQRVIDAVGTS
jgi:hypothetical protein